jgi:hypothetical protein
MELSKHVVLAYNPNKDIYILSDNTPYMYDCRKTYEIELSSDILDQLYNKAWHDAGICDHENQYLSDRSTFICSDCGDELGR